LLLAEYGGSMWFNGTLTLGRGEPMNEAHGKLYKVVLR